MTLHNWHATQYRNLKGQTYGQTGGKRKEHSSSKRHWQEFQRNARYTGSPLSPTAVQALLMILHAQGSGLDPLAQLPDRPGTLPPLAHPSFQSGPPPSVTAEQGQGPHAPETSVGPAPAVPALSAGLAGLGAYLATGSTTAALFLATLAQAATGQAQEEFDEDLDRVDRVLEDRVFGPQQGFGRITPGESQPPTEEDAVVEDVDDTTEDTPRVYSESEKKEEFFEKIGEKFVEKFSSSQLGFGPAPDRIQFDPKIFGETWASALGSGTSAFKLTLTPKAGAGVNTWKWHIVPGAAMPGKPTTIGDALSWASLIVFHVQKVCEIPKRAAQDVCKAAYGIFGALDNAMTRLQNLVVLNDSLRWGRRGEDLYTETIRDNTELEEKAFEYLRTTYEDTGPLDKITSRDFYRMKDKQGFNAKEHNIPEYTEKDWERLREAIEYSALMKSLELYDNKIMSRMEDLFTPDSRGPLRSVSRELMEGMHRINAIAAGEGVLKLDNRFESGIVDYHYWGGQVAARDRVKMARTRRDATIKGIFESSSKEKSILIQTVLSRMVGTPHETPAPSEEPQTAGVTLTNNLETPLELVQTRGGGYQILDESGASYGYIQPKKDQGYTIILPPSRDYDVAVSMQGQKFSSKHLPFKKDWHEYPGRRSKIAKNGMLNVWIHPKHGAPAPSTQTPTTTQPTRPTIPIQPPNHTPKPRPTKRKNTTRPARHKTTTRPTPKTTPRLTTAETAETPIPKATRLNLQNDYAPDMKMTPLPEEGGFIIQGDKGTTYAVIEATDSGRYIITAPAPRNYDIIVSAEGINSSARHVGTYYEYPPRDTKFTMEGRDLNIWIRPKKPKKQGKHGKQRKG